MDADKQRLDDDFLDRLLDAGIEGMKAPEARAGLEGRILARIAAEKPKSSWFGSPMRMGVALAVLAIIVGAVYLSRGVSVRRHPATTSARPRVAVAPAPIAPATPGGGVSIPAHQTAMSAPSRRSSAITRRRYRKIEAADAPRLPVFPSPAPLTEQEKILMGLRDPQQVLMALAKTQASTTADGPAPLKIAPVTIEPLKALPEVGSQPGQSDGMTDAETQPTDGRKR